MVHFTCQAQHLVRLEMTRINHANDFWWQGQYLVIEVGGWHLLLRALQITFICDQDHRVVLEYSTL